MKPIMRVRDVSKRYRLGASTRSLRQTLTDIFPRVVKGKQDEKKSQDFWALKNLNFDVYPGDILGIIGPNGAGKTTTLKLLSQVTQPTTGKIETSGRISTLIELGAGFHPELTGRENIYLNGVILGLKKRQIDQLFDQIVEFAGLEQFIDTPVKRYSSGMYARLGFSVAAHVEPEILLVDEVLSVGDRSFQIKCIERMKKLRQRGTTILFISHNMLAVSGLCTRGLVLHQGETQFLGPVEQAIQTYQQLLNGLSLK